MAKAKKVFICSSCGYQTPKWLGRCPSCGEWNTLVEGAMEKAAR
jgi:DNA repair protein RadA/Sms